MTMGNPPVIFSLFCWTLLKYLVWKQETKYTKRMFTNMWKSCVLFAQATTHCEILHPFFDFILSRSIATVLLQPQNLFCICNLSKQTFKKISALYFAPPSRARSQKCIYVSLCRLSGLDDENLHGLFYICIPVWVNTVVFFSNVAQSLPLIKLVMLAKLLKHTKVCFFNHIM